MVGLSLVAAGCGGTTPSACGPVEYGGAGSPELIVASDLPLHGELGRRASRVNDAIRAQLRALGYRAGGHRVAFQACDDSTVATGRTDGGRCRSNADTLADPKQAVIGVIGPLASACAAVMIPILNQAANGAIPLISPSNTYSCLTRPGPGCDLTEPDRYYPSGRRNYLRVAVADVVQGAALAQFARARGFRKVFVLHDGEGYGVGIASSFRDAAKALGLDVVGFASWDPKASSYAPLLRRVGSSGADAIVLGALADQNVGRVILDKVAALGPNDGRVALLAADGLTPQQAENAAGRAADGMYVSAAGTARLGVGRGADPVVTAGAQAAKILLAAIAKSDGTRADVTKKLFATKVRGSALGTFGFDANGDPTRTSGPIGRVTIVKAGRPSVVAATVEPGRVTARAVAG